jgi:hypothetical protein
MNEEINTLFKMKDFITPKKNSPTLGLSPKI